MEEGEKEEVSPAPEIPNPKSLVSHAPEILHPKS